MATAPSGICSSCRTIIVMRDVTNREAEVFVVCDNLEIIIFQSLFIFSNWLSARYMWIVIWLIVQLASWEPHPSRGKSQVLDNWQLTTLQLCKLLRKSLPCPGQTLQPGVPESVELCQKDWYLAGRSCWDWRGGHLWTEELLTARLQLSCFPAPEPTETLQPVLRSRDGLSAGQPGKLWGLRTPACPAVQSLPCLPGYLCYTATVVT